MGCQFSIKYKTSIDTLFGLAVEEAAYLQSRFSGDTKNGKFEIQALGGTFVGAYEVRNDIIEINIMQKPFFVPCALIESFLRSHIT